MAPRVILGLAFLGAAFLAVPPPVAAQSRLQLQSGVDTGGRATPLWHAVLQRRLDDSSYAAVRDLVRPVTDDELAWHVLIGERLAAWEEEIGGIVALYAPAPPPAEVVIVTGNRGASDAFTHDPRTIGFDLAALEGAYGSALLPANADRIDRLFRHEYAHLMQKAWLAALPYEADTPLRRALLELWLEGLATYHSFSDPWRSTVAGPPQRALETLALMEPRLLVRLAALSCAESGPGSLLTADLSEGPFREKWGSVTVGLWLEQEAAEAERPAEALRPVIEAGPDGLWALATKHLRPEFLPLLDEIQRAERLCRPGPGTAGT